MILNSVSLVRREPSAVFEIVPDEQVFVELTASPDRDGILQFGDSLAQIGVVPEGVEPTDPVQDRPDGGFDFVKSPDYLVPAFKDDSLTRLIDLPPGRYSLFSSAAEADLFACPREG